MAELWQFYDTFACKICYMDYSTTQLPMSVCKNHHIICRPCCDTMQQTRNYYCPFCKEWMGSSDMKQYKKFLDIKEVVKRVVEKEECYENELRLAKEAVAIGQKAKEEVKRLALINFELQQKLRKVSNDLHISKAENLKLLKKCTNRQWIDQQYVLIVQKLKKLTDQAKRYQQIAEENSKVWKLYNESEEKVKELTENLMLLSLSEVSLRLQKQIEENEGLIKKNADLTNNLAKLKSIFQNFIFSANQENLWQNKTSKKRPYVSLYKNAKSDTVIQSSKCNIERSNLLSLSKIMDLHNVETENEEETTLEKLKKLVHNTQNRKLAIQSI